MTDYPSGTPAPASRRNPASYRWLRRIVVIAVALPGIAGIGFYLLNQWQCYTLRAALAHDDTREQIRALNMIGTERIRQLKPAVRALLPSQQDRHVLEMAAYAAMRIGDVAALPLIQARADVGPDDTVRTRLIQFAARLSNMDLRLTDWLIQVAQEDSQPWRQVGGAIGLLEIADPRGGTLVMQIARSKSHPGAELAFESLLSTAKPMTEAVGWPIDWPDKLSAADDAFWSRLDDFWQRAASTQLLADVHNRRYAWDPRWYELNRLRHARDNVARWFE